MLYDYLIQNYDVAEPIFFSDIILEGVTRSAVNQQLKKLCDEQKIKKYDKGIYYIPKPSRLNMSMGLSADLVARYKYISRKGKVSGFYSGNSFANQIGISTQVPNNIEIVTNNIAAKVKKTIIGKRTFIVRRSDITVNEKNVYVLQMLDLLKNLDDYLDQDYTDAREKFRTYISEHHITQLAVDYYIREYPIRIFKYYYELRLNDVLA